MADSARLLLEVEGKLIDLTPKPERQICTLRHEAESDYTERLLLKLVMAIRTGLAA